MYPFVKILIGSTCLWCHVNFGLYSPIYGDQNHKHVLPVKILTNGYEKWIPRVKKVWNTQFHQINLFFSKIIRPSILQFSVLKGTPEWKLTHVTSQLNLKTLITHEIMEILTYFFLQIFIIFDGLPDSSKTSKTFYPCKFPFKLNRNHYRRF